GEAPAPAAAPPGPDRAGWWNDRVFYEVFVRSFKDSTTGPLAGDGVGDLRGLIEQLDYLNDGTGNPATSLGVGGLWLMPIHPSPTYHGYDVTDYSGVHPQYGTLQDFRELMSECHKRDIRVIIDLVLNHCSDQHPWFKSARAGGDHRDWFIWADQEPSWRGPWNQRVWHRSEQGLYYGLFNRSMPDLNFRHQGPTDAMRGVAAFWLRDQSVDGFRLDAIRHLIEDGAVQESTPATHAWLRGFQQHCKQVRPEAMTVGEVWADTPQSASYVGAEMDMTFEFALAQAIRESVKTKSGEPYKRALSRVLASYPPNQFGAFLTNHDMTRVMTDLRGDPDAARLAAAIYLLGPGVPFIYYGEELGMPGDKPDPDLRTPMAWDASEFAGFSGARPWRPLTPGHSTRNVVAQNADPGSLLRWYRTLIHLRGRSPALNHGGTTMLESAPPGVIALVRETAGERAFVLVNCTDAPAEVQIPALLPMEEAHATTWVGLLGPELPHLSRAVTLEPSAVRVLLRSP
ncbi:MAG: alpha-amylase family glycosyl hydrolase, partial [Phycisphaerales bacterium]